MTFIAPIVEGHGEVLSVKALLHRIATDAAPGALLRVNAPIRVKSGSFLAGGPYADNYVRMAAAKAREHADGHVLLMLDSEDDCPGTLGPRLLERCRQASAGVNVVVALAFREYETWFVAAAESLRGVQGLSAGVTAPANPEGSRDAKGWLRQHMPHGYDPISDQLPFTQRFELAAARRVDSFDRLYRKVQALLLTPPAEGAVS